MTENDEICKQELMRGTPGATGWLQFVNKTQKSLQFVTFCDIMEVKGVAAE